MPKRILFVCLLIPIIFIFTGCRPAPQVSDQQVSLILTELADKQAAELSLPLSEVDVITQPAASTPAPTLTDLPEETTATGDWIESEAAGAHLGEIKTVRVELSHCDFKTGINGKPTFCNDQPYPNHTFTYLIWGEDWSRFDQTCVLVSGEIVEYDGKAQIVLENEEQIILCEGL